MSSTIDVSLGEVAAALVLVAIAVVASRWRHAGLEEDIAIAVARSFVQLTAIGYVIDLIFEEDDVAPGDRADRGDGRLRRASPRVSAPSGCPTPSGRC